MRRYDASIIKWGIFFIALYVTAVVLDFNGVGFKLVMYHY
jgi:hypothetical protein